MRSIKWSAVLLLVLIGFTSRAQVVGGQYAFEYLRLPDAPHISALGGFNVANPDDDIAFALQNPALMRPGLHNELQLNYNAYYADIGIMNLQYGYNVPKIATAFALGVQYLNYGTFTQTDNAGNQYGDFKASDYAITLAASRQYLKHWRYGAALKWAHSNLQSTAAAILADVGVNYYDTSSMWDIGATAKNMGAMVKRYDPSMPQQPLPFDLQIGVSKQFKHLPLRLFTTIHHLYEWDIRYNNPADITSTNLLGTTDSSSFRGNHFGDKLFRHFIFGAEIVIGKRIVLTGSYNDLERRELELSTKPALAGFAFGAGINLNKFQIHYARTYYSVAGAYNTFSLTLALNKIIGLGKTGENIHWNAEYPDWE